MELFTDDRKRSQNATKSRVVDALRGLKDEGDFLVLRHHRKEVRAAGPYPDDTFLMQCNVTRYNRPFRGQREGVTRKELERILLAFLKGNTDWCLAMEEQARPKPMAVALLLAAVFVLQAAYFLL